MLVLRRPQIKAISYLARERFVQRMEAHVRQYFPEDTGALEPDALRAVVEQGIERAEKHGFTADRDITRYLNLMFTFGREFDRDPSLGWATRLFARKGRLKPGSLMNKLYIQGLRHERTGQGLDPGKGQ